MNSTNNKGFTFVEVIVTVFLLGMLTMGIIMFEKLISSGQSVITINSQTYNEASIAMDAMINEIRNSKAAVNGAFPLEVADDQKIVFYANIDSDASPEKIRYELVGNELVRGIINPEGDPATYPAGSELIDLVIPDVQNGSNSIFTYYNGDWPVDTTNNPLPAPARLTDTKFVTINITINPTPAKIEANYDLTSSVQIRSVKTNL